jgi:hypothetical protein
MEETFYGEIHDIQIDAELYQLQKVELEDETFFLLKRSGEIFCMIMQEENNQWKPDCEIPGYTFNQIINRIIKLYFKDAQL